jgi:hypothetical protein
MRYNVELLFTADGVIISANDYFVVAIENGVVVRSNYFVRNTGLPVNTYGHLVEEEE